MTALQPKALLSCTLHLTNISTYQDPFNIRKTDKDVHVSLLELLHLCKLPNTAVPFFTFGMKKYMSIPGCEMEMVTSCEIYYT